MRAFVVKLFLVLLAASPALGGSQAKPNLRLELEVSSPGSGWDDQGLICKYIWGGQHLQMAFRLINHGPSAVTVCPAGDDWRKSVSIVMKRVQRPALRAEKVVTLEWDPPRIRKQHADYTVEEATDYRLEPGAKLLGVALLTRPDGFVFTRGLYIFEGHFNREKDRQVEEYWSGQVVSPEIALLIRPKRTPQDRVQYCWLEAAYLSHRGRYEEALHLLREGRKIDPESLQCLAGLGDTYFMMGELEKAIEIYERVLQTEPDATAVAEGLKRARKQLEARAKTDASKKEK